MMASEVIADHVPIAFPRSPAGNAAAMIARLPGTSSAPPSPCTARAAIKWRALGATPHHTDAAAKIAIPTPNTRSRPR